MRVRIDAQMLLDPGHGGLGVVIDNETSRSQPDDISGRTQNEVALRHVALVARWQEQELALALDLALVRAAVADIAKPVVAQDAEGIRWGFEHDRTRFGVDPARVADHRGIRRQPQRLRVHAFLEDQYVAIHGTEFPKRGTECCDNQPGAANHGDKNHEYRRRHP